MLVDEGAIEARADGWALHADRLAALHVPATLSGVLQARLDALAPDEKRALQQASVIGVVFWDQALAAIDAAAPRALPGAVQRRLVEPHQDTLLEGVERVRVQAPAAARRRLRHGAAARCAGSITPGSRTGWHAWAERTPASCWA